MVAQWVIDRIGPPPMQPKHYPAFMNGEISWEEIPQEIKDSWRDWARQEEDLVNKGMEHGMSLEEMGYQNKKDLGMSMHARFGKGGFFSEYGANVDPGWHYDWGTGRKYNKGTSDKYANGELGIRWEPISQEEWSGYRQAQSAKSQGLDTYAKQTGSRNFQMAAKRGHFTLDPKTGLYHNIGLMDPSRPDTWDWRDQHGNRVSAPQGITQRTAELHGGGGYNFGGGNQFGGGQAAGTFGQMNYNPYANAQGGGAMGAENQQPPQGYLPFLPAPPLPGNMQPQQNNSAYRQQSAQNEQADRNSPYRSLMPNQQRNNSSAMGAF